MTLKFDLLTSSRRETWTCDTCSTRWRDDWTRRTRCRWRYGLQGRSEGLFKLARCAKGAMYNFVKLVSKVSGICDLDLYFTFDLSEVTGSGLSFLLCINRHKQSVTTVKC